MTCVRLGVTKPFATVRPDSSNSLATAMSISDAGCQREYGTLTVEVCNLGRKDLNIISRGTGPLCDARNRGAMHRETGLCRRRHDPLRQHAAAFAHECGDQYCYRTCRSHVAASPA